MSKSLGKTLATGVAGGVGGLGGLNLASKMFGGGGGESAVIPPNLVGSGGAMQAPPAPAGVQQFALGPEYGGFQPGAAPQFALPSNLGMGAGGAPAFNPQSMIHNFLSGGRFNAGGMLRGPEGWNAITGGQQNVLNANPQLAHLVSGGPQGWENNQRLAGRASGAGMGANPMLMGGLFG